VENKDRKFFVEELRWQWKSLWRTRIDDKVKAEGIASQDYSKLFVEKGTVIIATRDYKPLNFHEILETYLPSYVTEIVNPNPSLGGVRKFIRQVIHKREDQTKKHASLKPEQPKNQQLKKSGKGWLHYHM
jgi:hypothetical protein